MELNLLRCCLCVISCKRLRLWKPYLLPVVTLQGNAAFVQGVGGGSFWSALVGVPTAPLLLPALVLFVQVHSPACGLKPWVKRVEHRGWNR